MSSRSLFFLIALVVCVHPVAAQEAAPATAPPDSAPQPAPKKKGMFGKLKSIAGNKTVQSVAKVAACTMVPGGQFVAAGIDAASAAGEKDATGAASGAAGAATGTACLGGMPGGAGAAGMGAVPGMAAVGASSAAAMTAMAGMTQLEGQPGAPAAPGELSPKDEKRMRSMLMKQGMSDEQINSTIALYKQQARPDPEAPTEGSRFGAQAEPSATASNAAAQPVGLPSDYQAQLQAGKLVLVDLPWRGSTADLIAGTEQGVRVTFVRVVEVLNRETGTWRVDVYVAELDKGVAQARATAIMAWLRDAGLPTEARLGGKSAASPKNAAPRIELVRN